MDHLMIDHNVLSFIRDSEVELLSSPLFRSLTSA